jgi:hypothetical protein
MCTSCMQVRMLLEECGLPFEVTPGGEDCIEAFNKVFGMQSHARTLTSTNDQMVRGHSNTLLTSMQCVCARYLRLIMGGAAANANGTPFSVCAYLHLCVCSCIYTFANSHMEANLIYTSHLHITSHGGKSDLRQFEKQVQDQVRHTR